MHSFPCRLDCFLFFFFPFFSFYCWRLSLWSFLFLDLGVYSNCLIYTQIDPHADPSRVVEQVTQLLATHLVLGLISVSLQLVTAVKYAAFSLCEQHEPRATYLRLGGRIAK